jgi:type I restriction enzyme S subunit
LIELAEDPGVDPIAELPDGWVRVALGEACQINPRKPPRGLLPPDAPVTFVPMAAVDEVSGAITAPAERTFADVRGGYTAFQDGDVIVAKITPCMENGKAAVARDLTNGVGFGSTEFHVLRSEGAVLPEYLFHYVRQQSFRQRAEAAMSGAVGQLRVPSAFLEESLIPLPPLAEQHRIVAQVEVLRARADAAYERLALLPRILRRFRQAILARASCGELTEDLHEDSGAPTDDLSAGLPCGWIRRPAGDLYVDARYGTSEKCDRDSAQGIPVLRIPNIAAGRVELTDLKYTHAPHRELQRLYLAAGDVVVCRTNGSLELIGKAAVVPELPGPHAFASYLIRLRLRQDMVLPAYFHIVLSSRLGRDHIEREARTTAGQFNLNLEILRSLSVPLPPLEEQHEIIRRVKALVALADKIELQLAAATRRAQELTQSILARAFRGELVPTEAELARREGRMFEPASELMERISAQGVARAGSAVKRRARKEPLAYVSRLAATRRVADQHRKYRQTTLDGAGADGHD